MPNSKNEFLVQRTVKGSFTIANGASTTATGLIIPKGAIVTGVRLVAPNAVTLTNASGTVQIAVGAVNICATTNISALGAVTVPTVRPLASTGGNYITVNSEVSIIEGTTASSSATATYDIYVDYLYA